MKPASAAFSRSLLRSQRGFSIVEIMVGVVIALLSTLVIFQVFAASESYKRSTTSGGDSQNNGMLALFSLEREIRQSGYGINLSAIWGCDVRFYDESQGGLQPTFVLAPVIIRDGATGAPDTVSVIYGNSGERSAPTLFEDDAAIPGNPYPVNNVYGFSQRNGDVILGAQQGLPCSIGQITGVGGLLVAHDNAAYVRPEGGAPVAPIYNQPGGMGVMYNKGARLFNLGPSPSSNVMTVDPNGQLTLDDRLQPAGAAALMDGIVSIQAQYGIDTSATPDGTVDAYVDPRPVTGTAADDTPNHAIFATGSATQIATGWGRVLAIRIAVVARANLQEKEIVSPATLKLWPDSALAPTTTGPVFPVPNQNFRYRVFETIVPLRNSIWNPV